MPVYGVPVAQVGHFTEVEVMVGPALLLAALGPRWVRRDGGGPVPLVGT